MKMKREKHDKNVNMRIYILFFNNKHLYNFFCHERKKRIFSPIPISSPAIFKRRKI